MSFYFVQYIIYWGLTCTTAACTGPLFLYIQGEPSTLTK